ncbi:unnamed protein product [Cyprideis torosa]|uniref:DNA helicase n=1 Tax=Cyprideis torosa TaxID=163714 RepID=A0A7R8ZJN2_9CRUS|nr:unnamed protein product [Cyprideis torosa]CAG0882667.1 unnamed protein product [Cyprideis torosa]
MSSRRNTLAAAWKVYLESERAAELASKQVALSCLTTSKGQLEKEGVLLSRLTICNISTGLYGRTIMEFTSKRQQLPAHIMTMGDIVSVYPSGSWVESASSSGVVTRTSDTSLFVAFDVLNDKEPLTEGDAVAVLKVANDVTYRRLNRTVDILSSHGSSHVALIHGPPGTGKTRTLVECLMQFAIQKKKILACAPSNVAVDNMLDRLTKYAEKRIVKVVRLGNPARAMDRLQKYSLDAVIANSEERALIMDARKEADVLVRQLQSKKIPHAQKNAIRQNLIDTRKECRKRERTVTKVILSRADIVLSTLGSAGDDGSLREVKPDHFDIAVVDEAAQALEVACWVAGIRAPKLVLAGDPFQLPPTSLTPNAPETMFQRLMTEKYPTYPLLLQYRMNKKIMRWSNELFYENKLLCDASVENHVLSELPGVTENQETLCPLMLVDTTGCDYEELPTPEGMSRGNVPEVYLVRQVVDTLVQSGVDPIDIAVIAPYNLQVDLLRRCLRVRWPNLEIRTVDGFQGREKEAVIISMVRSNKEGEVGFLSEIRRMNVAVTRARRHLCVVGDSGTVSKGGGKHLEGLMTIFETNGTVLNAALFQEAVEKAEMEGHVDISDLPLAKTTTEMSKSTALIKKTKKKKTAKEGLFPEVSNTAASGSVQSSITMSPAAVCSQDETQPSEDQKLKERYRKILEEKLAKGLPEVVIEECATSFERRLVHELAEEMKLCHESRGEGKERRLYVWCVPPDESSQRTEATPGDPDFKRGSISVGLEAGVTIKAAAENESAKKVDSKKKKTKTKEAAAFPDPIVSAEDDEAVMEAFAAEKKMCSFAIPTASGSSKKCKNSVATLAQVCNYCRKVFCLSHSLPEVHGCGEEAKKAERAAFRKTNLKPESNKEKVKRQLLGNELEKKLNKMALSRTGKPPAKKK